MERYPGPAKVYIRAVILVGAIAMALVYRWPGALRHDHLWLILLGASLSVLASIGKVPVTGSSGHQVKDTSSHISLGFVPTFLVLVLQGPLAAMVSATINVTITCLYPRRSYTHQILFNIASINLAVLAAAVVLRCFGMAPVENLEKPPLIVNMQQMEVIVPYLGIMLATAVYYGVNTLLIALVIGLCSGRGVGDVWRTNFAWAWTSYFAGAACSVFIVVLMPQMARVPVATMAISILAVPIPALMLVLHRYHWQSLLKNEQHIAELQQKQEDLEQANAELQQSKEQLQRLFHSTVESLALAIDAKDRYTREHIHRVRKMALAIGREVGLDQEELNALETAALLHDIGKIAIPEQILTKPDRLNEEEMERIRAHPELGARILEPVDFPYPVIPAVRSHHERWDGTGYPDKLKGEEIPLGGRILAVADVFDALTTDRVYRPGWSEDDALAYIRENAGRHFDPRVVDCFFAALERSPRLHLIEGMHRLEEAGPDTITENITRASFEYLSLYEISQTISDSLQLSDTLALLAVKICSLFNATNCVLFLKNSQHCFDAQKAVGPDEEWLGRTRLAPRPEQLSRGFCGAFDSTLLTVPGEGNGEMPAFQSVLMAPLQADGEVIGMVALYHDRADSFDPEDLQVLRAVAARAGHAIGNARQYDETLKSAYCDELTGLANARRLMQFLNQQVERAENEHTPLAVLVLDLDEFKPVNDRLGHLAGNEVLKGVGNALQSVLSEGELVARYAGDEFVVVLPGADAAKARQTAENLRAAVAKFQLIQNDQVVPGLYISVSLGWATYGDNGTDANHLISAADRAMYLDKSQRKRGRLATAIHMVDGRDTEKTRVGVFS